MHHLNLCVIERAAIQPKYTLQLILDSPQTREGGWLQMSGITAAWAAGLAHGCKGASPRIRTARVALMLYLSDHAGPSQPAMSQDEGGCDGGQ